MDKTRNTHRTTQHHNTTHVATPRHATRHHTATHTSPQHTCCKARVAGEAAAVLFEDRRMPKRCRTRGVCAHGHMQVRHGGPICTLSKLWQIMPELRINNQARSSAPHLPQVHEAGRPTALECVTSCWLCYNVSQALAVLATTERTADTRAVLKLECDIEDSMPPEHKTSSTFSQ